MTKLFIVPPREQTPAEKLQQVVKSLPLPDGVLQCKKCGGTTIMTTTVGAKLDEKGHYKRGTVWHDRVCYQCHMQGVHSFMLPDEPRIVKERKPRTTKPRAIK